MVKQKTFRKEIASLGILLFLSLGAFSVATAAMETDPMDFVEFSTFLGGTDDDHMDVVYAYGSMVIDSEGNIIVVGRTTSTDFPLKGAFQDTLNGYSDSTISKFYPNGSLAFSTYFGGSEQELITGVAVDSDDNIVIAGVTGSSDLPVVNAFQSNISGVSGGVTDCFIAKFSEDGQSLLFSTYFGGASNDYAYAMAIDSSDRIVITGTTQSTDFPLLHPVQDSNAGFLDVFVSLFDANVQSLLFSTYLGTTSVDHGRDIKFDSQGDIWLTGIAAVGNLATECAYQEENAGGISDAFLAKFSISGTLQYLTFLGGEDLEWGNALAIDSDDNLIVTGFTTSDDFPTSNPYQDQRVDFADMFITKFTPDGQNVVFSTYLGGSFVDHSNAITIDSDDNIIVTGQTTSDDFPTTLPYSTTDTNHMNATLVALSPDGLLLTSMVFGRLSNEIGIEVVWYSEYDIIILGYTESADFPVHDAYQETYGGECDMFIMKMDLQSLIVSATLTTSTTSTPTSPTSTQPGNIPVELVIGGIAVGVIAVVVILFFVRNRAG